MTPDRSWLAPLRTSEWVVYAKRPCAGPGAVLACLSRDTHRVAISNRRLASLDADVVSFRWKDCRAKGRTRHKTMTLTAEEFMRGFLLHVLPCGFHRIRHYGLLANAGRRPNLARARELLGATPPDEPRTIASAPEAAALSTTPPPRLRVPLLRIGDARHRDLRSGCDDPRATAARGKRMTGHPFNAPSHTPAPGRMRSLGSGCPLDEDPHRALLRCHALPAAEGQHRPRVTCCTWRSTMHIAYLCDWAALKCP
jgi:hypothetical protein